MTRARVRPGAAGQLRDVLRRVTLAAAEGGAATLREKLSGPGSGTYHPGQPNQSSAPGEYPAEQSGAVRDSVMAVPIGDTRSAFGSVDGPAHVIPLHFKPPDAGGRPFMDDAKHDRDIHAGMRDAVRQEVQRAPQRPDRQ
ncbi:hypothetical protein GCM10017784_11220 [Deinococcus indicus]|uniref:hypothetical protein n=1 Tax=Deinococcus indicus TaxID=223556 RepID=UPI00174E7BAE|nr:hypothetical protein [Deinococcus indicus]GHG21481.1 hypothetical protein GCM10017784_11220 [Deinococcus indicus]